MRMYSARPGGDRYRPVLDRLPVAMSGAVALAGAGGLAFGLSCLGELRATWFAFVAYTALCAVLGGFSRPCSAPLIAGAAWLFHNGFAEHRFGALGWSGTGPEVLHLAVFATAAAATALPVALPRRRVRTDLLRKPDHTRTSWQ
ncbi:hypothetical protein [Kitasatospora sp. NPDC050543]|uniref:hypothetical protein n=1 Tax=Kitasatospora sp. NPDC050543 TaxID=3364054 RepID=UPI0037AF1A97